MNTVIDLAPLSLCDCPSLPTRESPTIEALAWHYLWQEGNLEELAIIWRDHPDGAKRYRGFRVSTERYAFALIGEGGILEVFEYKQGDIVISDSTIWQKIQTWHRQEVAPVLNSLAVYVGKEHWLSFCAALMPLFPNSSRSVQPSSLPVYEEMYLRLYDGKKIDEYRAGTTRRAELSDLLKVAPAPSSTNAALRQVLGNAKSVLQEVHEEDSVALATVLDVLLPLLEEWVAVNKALTDTSDLSFHLLKTYIAQTRELQT